MQGDDRNDQFDDLFEPFELDETQTAEHQNEGASADVPEVFNPQPPPRLDETGEQPQATAPLNVSDQAPAGEIVCPSCGARNPSFNHHCERCGSRLTHDPMPIAPRPGARNSAGGRALGVLSAVVLVVALVALTMNIFGSGDGETTVADTTPSSTSTTIPTPTVELFASSVTASSQFSASFAPENLLDGDATTYWNDDSQRGVDAWLTFTFATPVEIREIELQNVLDDEKFRLNYKIQGFTVDVNDLDANISGRLENTNQPQTVRILSLNTITLTISVTTVHPAENVVDQVPFEELALQGVRFFGVEK